MGRDALDVSNSLLTPINDRCGNGLLTHILVSEGYDGGGIDIRSRQSWVQYPQRTQAQLRVFSFDPTSKELPPFLLPGVFIIGNHADELTPWIPIIATIHKASGYLSIPCCAWSFDAKFERSSTPFFPVSSEGIAKESSLIHPESGLPIEIINDLNLGGGQQSYELILNLSYVARLPQSLLWMENRVRGFKDSKHAELGHRR